MSLSLKDRVKELTKTTGTGTLTLVSAPSGFRRFNSVLSNGDTTYYCLESGSSWEVGIGTYSANTLARTTVIASSNANALVNITASRSFVFITYAADKAVYKDSANRTVIESAGLIFSDASVQTTAATSPDLSPYLTISSAASTYLPLAGGTLTGNLLFTDATYDIGKTGATRPRDGWFSRTVNVGTGVTILNNNVSGNGWALLFNGTNSGIEDNQGAGSGLRLRGNVVTCDNNYIRGVWSHLDFTLGNIDQTFITLGQVSSTTTTSSKLVVRAAEGLHVRHTTLTSPALLSITETYTSTTSFGSFQIKANTGAAYQIGSAIGSAGGTNRAIDFGHWNAAGTFASALNIATTGAATFSSTINTMDFATGNYNLGVGYSTNVSLGFASTALGWTARATHNYAISIGASAASAAANQFTVGDSTNVSKFRFGTGVAAVTFDNPLILGQLVSTSGSPTALTITGAAHTTLTLSTEATDVNFNLSRTVQFATGALTTQRAMRIQAPTYSFVGASTITTASTLSISGPPVAGTNATITNAYALHVESGNSYFAGNVRAVGSSVYAPSYGFGSDNSGFFRSSSSRIFLGLNGNVLYDFNSGNLCINSASYGVAGGSVDSNSADVLWVRDGAGIWATRNGTNAQTFRVYNTYTSSTSFENLQFKANAGAAYQIGSAIGSAGGTNRDLNFGSWDTAGTFTSSFYTSSTYAGINDSKIFYVGTSSRIEFSALSSLGSPAIRFAWGGGSPACVYGGSNTLGVGINGFTRLLFGVSSTDFTGSPFTISNTAVATGAYTGFTYTGAAHTNQTASTEATMVNWNLAQTVQFATGAITTQRAMRIQAPTYGFVGASTITTASTLSISGPPVAGTNATITKAYALNIESGYVNVAGGVLTGGTSVNAHTSSTPLLGLGGDGTNHGWLSLRGNSSASFGRYGLFYDAASDSTAMFGYLGRTLTLGHMSFAGSYTPGWFFTANTLQQRSGTTAQSFQVYNTYTSATSYERVNVRGKASANFEIGPENGSAGGTLRGLTLGCYPAGTSTIVGWAQFQPNASTGALEAFYLGSIADSTATGGNARGLYAVDLQVYRTAANQVVSGTSSFAAGQGNRISGTYCGGIGNAHVVTSNNSFAVGNTHSVTHDNSSAFGVFAATRMSGMRVVAQDSYDSQGAAQLIEATNKSRTTSATPVNWDLPLTSGNTYHFNLIVGGVKSDGTAIACYTRRISAINIAGTVTIINSQTIGTDYEDNASTDLTVSASGSNVRVAVTGIAAETWRWQFALHGVEIKYGT